MRNRIIIKNIVAGLIVALFIVSCKENEPKGDEFSWSPDGKKLAMVNVESNELLLVELEANQINQVTSIDTFSGEKAKIYMPAWSPDGSYLLYAKSSKTALEIRVYCLSENKTTQVDYIPIDEKKEGDGKVFVSWSPTGNRVLWLSWNNLAEHLLFSALPDGKDKKRLIKLIDEKVFPFPAWSPDGEWIAYAVYIKDGDPKNGLWKMKYDGSEKKQIFSTNEITAFQWQPGGSHLAIVQKVIFQRNKQQGKTEIKYHYNLSLIDSSGNSERLLSEEHLQIVELAWSPDGKQLAVFEVQDDSRDIWVVNLFSNQKVKLNFNKVQDFFGWANSNQLFFTIEYPENLVSQTKEQEDARELLETLQGVQKENLLVMSLHFQQQNLNKNIFAFTVGGQNSAVAYYKSYTPEISGDGTYYPIIEFSNGKRIYSARTKAQYVTAADECYLNGRYQEALDHLSQYLEVDLNSANFSAKLDIDKIVEEANLSNDSASYKKIYERLVERNLFEAILLRTALTMRKLNQLEQADWVFEQFMKSTFYHYNAVKYEKDKRDFPDEIFWETMSTYGRYHEFASGIQDLDRFLQSEKPDSSLITYANSTQFIMAFESKQYDVALEKMKTAIQFLPKELTELDDIANLLMLYRGNFNQKQEGMLVPILHQVIYRFPNDEHISQIYEMLGDLQLKRKHRDEALAAYQSAVVKEFDNHKIWDKILGIM